MREAHFFYKIYANNKMEFQLEILIKSIINFSKLDILYFTVMIPEEQDIKNNYLKLSHEFFNFKTI
jgi:hypothetical protein